MQKVIKRKGDKLYVKWKGYDNSFNSWIDKKKISVIVLYKKWVNFFQNLMNYLVGMLTLK